MYDKTYSEHIALLRTRTVKPSFAQSARLITEVGSAPNMVPLIKQPAMLLIVAGLVTAGVWLFSLNRSPVGSKGDLSCARSNVNDLSQSQASVTNEPARSSRIETLRTCNVGSQKVLNAETHSNRRDVKLCRVDAKTVQKESVKESDLVTMCSVKMQDITVPSHFIQPRSLSPIVDSTPFEEQHWFTELGGAVSQQLSADGAFKVFSCSDAFISEGYALNEHSSFRVVAAEEVFTMPNTLNTISYHDTSFIHYGQTFNNLIGVVQPTSVPASTRVYSVAGSYRYTFGEVSWTMRPFSEVVAGASTKGFLSRGGVGVEIAAWYPIQMNLQIIASALFPKNSAWLLKSSLALSASYSW